MSIHSSAKSFVLISHFCGSMWFMLLPPVNCSWSNFNFSRWEKFGMAFTVASSGGEKWLDLWKGLPLRRKASLIHRQPEEARTDCWEMIYSCMLNMAAILTRKMRLWTIMFLELHVSGRFPHCIAKTSNVQEGTNPCSNWELLNLSWPVLELWFWSISCCCFKAPAWDTFTLSCEFGHVERHGWMTSSDWKMKRNPEPLSNNLSCIHFDFLEDSYSCTLNIWYLQLTVFLCFKPIYVLFFCVTVQYAPIYCTCLRLCIDRFVFLLFTSFYTCFIYLVLFSHIYRFALEHMSFLRSGTFQAAVLWALIETSSRNSWKFRAWRWDQRCGCWI